MKILATINDKGCVNLYKVSSSGASRYKFIGGAKGLRRIKRWYDEWELIFGFDSFVLWVDFIQRNDW